jgi:hypothetical protein
LGRLNAQIILRLWPSDWRSRRSSRAASRRKIVAGYSRHRSIARTIIEDGKMGIGVRIALARPAVAWSHRRATSASARYSTPGQIHKLYGQVVASYLKNTHLEEGISGGPG